MDAPRSCSLQAADFKTGSDSGAQVQGHQPQLIAVSRGPGRLSDLPLRSHGKSEAATSVTLLTLTPELPARQTSPMGPPPPASL